MTFSNKNGMLEQTVALNSLYLFEYLGKDLINLASTNKQIHNFCVGFINKHFTFRFQSELKLYLPQKIRVGRFLGSTVEHDSIYNSLFDFNFFDLHFTITHLSFGNNFNLPIDDFSLSHLSRLSHLSFGNKFNQPVDNLLPSSVTHLTFGASFNSPIDHLPSSLIYLSLDIQFNRPINEFPKTLSHVKFGPNFKYAFKSLPPSLTTFKLGDTNRDWLRFIYPHTYTPPISFPPLLTTLHIGNLNKKSLVDILLPNSLLELHIRFFPGLILPPNLNHLKLFIFENLKNEVTNLEGLPESLLSLEILSYKISGVFDIQSLPPNLIEFKSTVVCTFASPLPSTITCLKIVEHNTLNATQLLQIFSLPQLIHFKFTVESLLTSVLDELKYLALPPKLQHFTAKGNPINPTLLMSIIDFCSAPLTMLKLTSESTIKPLPPTIRTLHLKSLEQISELPPFLEELSLSGNIEVPQVFPSTLRILKLYDCETLPPIPSQLQELHLSVLARTLTLPPLPESLKVLWVHTPLTEFPILPETLEEFVARKVMDPWKLPHSLPPRLHTLKFTTEELYPLHPIPPTMETLEIQNQYLRDFNLSDVFKFALK